jgi:hypothetical protein
MGRVADHQHARYLAPFLAAPAARQTPNRVRLGRRQGQLSIFNCAVQTEYFDFAAMVTYNHRYENQQNQQGNADFNHIAGRKKLCSW